jgi:hypothetical protein
MRLIEALVRVDAIIVRSLVRVDFHSLSSSTLANLNEGIVLPIQSNHISHMLGSVSVIVNSNKGESLIPHKHSQAYQSQNIATLYHGIEDNQYLARLLNYYY